MGALLFVFDQFIGIIGALIAHLIKIIMRSNSAYHLADGLGHRVFMSSAGRTLNTLVDRNTPGGALLKYKRAMMTLLTLELLLFSSVKSQI